MDQAEYYRRWRDKDPERARRIQRAADARAMAKNPRRRQENYKKWAEANPALAKARRDDKNHRRRDQIAGAKITSEQYQAILDEFNGGCAYCPSAFEHWDHYVPLSRGGRHEVGNVVPSCADCNLHKSAKLPIWEWV